MRVTKARSSKSKACYSRTLKRRDSKVRGGGGGGGGGGVGTLLSPERPETVLEEEIRVLGREEKNKILTEAGISLNIDANTGLALKATLGHTMEPTSNTSKVIQCKCLVYLNA